MARTGGRGRVAVGAPAATIDAVDRLEPEQLVVLGGETVVSDAAAALQPCTAPPPPPAGNGPTFTVDPSLVPRVATIPAHAEGGAPRPVARVADAFGTATDFVEDELVVSGDQAALDAVVARYAGEVLVSYDPRGDGPPMTPARAPLQASTSSVRSPHAQP